MRAVICRWCGFADDLGDPVERVLPQRCPCPHDELSARARQRDVDLRHGQSLARARHRAESAREAS